MYVYFSLSTIYFCLSRFLPVGIYADHYFHQSDAFATRRSGFWFPFTFWLIFGKFSSKFFPKNSVQKNKHWIPKVCWELKAKQETLKPFSISLPKARKSQKAKNALNNADDFKFFSRLLPRDYIGISLFNIWLLVDGFYFWLLADVWKLILLWSL